MIDQYNDFGERPDLTPRCPRCKGVQTVLVNGDNDICPVCGGTGKNPEDIFTFTDHELAELIDTITEPLPGEITVTEAELREWQVVLETSLHAIPLDGFPYTRLRLNDVYQAIQEKLNIL
jgi:RNA polymerase subunit RPABC4/transcription elongation factor Spt4